MSLKNQKINPPLISFNTQGEEVKILHKDLLDLGYNLPKVEIDSGIFGRGTSGIIEQLQQKYRTPITGEFDVTLKTAMQKAIETPTKDKNLLEGILVFENGRPATGTELIIKFHGFGGTVKSIETTMVDADGKYTLAYSPAENINISVAVKNQNDDEIALSAVKHQATHHEVLNLVAPSSLQTLAPEYTRLKNDLVKHLDGKKLSDAKENEDCQDISMLHSATGWDTRVIALAALSERIAQQPELKQLQEGVVYALIRAGLPANVPQLAQLPSDLIKQTLEKTKAKGISKVNIAKAVKDFKNFANSYKLKQPTAGTLSPPKEFFDIASLNATKRKTLENLYVEGGKRGEDLWKALKTKGFATKEIDTLQVQGKLAFLTGNSAPLSKLLYNPTSMTSTTLADTLVSRQLYKPQTWETMLTLLKPDPITRAKDLVPPIYQKENHEDSLKSYAEDMARKVRISYPTKVLREQILKDDIKLGTNHSLKKEVATFLGNGDKLKYRLGETGFNQFFIENKTELLKGIPNGKQPEVVKEVKKLHRLYQLTSSDEMMQIAYEQEFTSAEDIVAFTPNEFVEYFKGKNAFQNENNARQIYRKAQQVRAVTQNVYKMAADIKNAIPIRVLSPTDEQKKTSEQNLIRKFPSLENLFGSLDYCECEHCRSVLSPAAYLVDLLQYLEPKNLVWNKLIEAWREKNGKEYPLIRDTNGNVLPDAKPYRALIQRRPDIAHLPLTCENTHTVLPYIDVVNEILEYYVANNHQLGADAARDTGKATTEELLAEPQYIEPKAYAMLSEAKYPLNLPFNIWIESTRSFAQHSKLKFHELLEIFSPEEKQLFPPSTNRKSHPYPFEIAMERLGLSKSEYGIFTQHDPKDWFQLYGYENPYKALADLKSAKVLSRRLGITYKELIAIVKTSFINPDLEVMALLRNLNLDANDALNYLTDQLTVSAKVEFEGLLQDINEKYPGFDSHKWLITTFTQGELDNLVVLHSANTECNFDKTTLKYINREADATLFLKINLIVRLQKHLGYSISELDQILHVTVPKAFRPITPENSNAAFTMALLYISDIQSVARELSVGKKVHNQLLGLWGSIETGGTESLFQKRFLTTHILKSDAIFDHPLGQYLQYYDTSSSSYKPFFWDAAMTDDNIAKGEVGLKNHLSAVQAALGLNVTDIESILAFPDTLERQTLRSAALSIPNLSKIYRYGWLSGHLGISIPELMIMIQLSGLNPFKPLARETINEISENPLRTDTIPFINAVQQVRESPFAIDQLNYLLRHQFDPENSSYHIQPNTVLNFWRNIRVEMERVQSVHPIPQTESEFTDELLLEKVSLLISEEVTARFLEMWNGSAVYQVVIDPPLATIPQISDKRIEITQDKVQAVTLLSFTGVLTNLQLPILQDEFRQIEVKNALSEINDMGSKYAQAHLTRIFEDGAYSKTGFNALFAKSADREVRNRLISTIIPRLHEHLFFNFIRETLSTDMDINLSLTELLINETAILHSLNDNTQPLLSDFVQLSLSEITYNFEEILVGAGSVITTIMDTYLEVPKTGGYRFFVTSSEANTVLRLFFEHHTDPFIQIITDNNNQSGENILELEAGIPYRIRLEAKNSTTCNIKIEVLSADLPKGRLDRLVTYPAQDIDNTHAAYEKLHKIVALIAGLGLSEEELSHMAANVEHFEGIDWNMVPAIADLQIVGTSKKLFFFLQRLMDYRDFKQTVKVDGKTMVELFAKSHKKIMDPAPDESKIFKKSVLEVLGRILRREPNVLEPVLEDIGITANIKETPDYLELSMPDLRNELQLYKIFEIVKTLNQMGITLETAKESLQMVSVTNLEELTKITENFKNSLKAKYSSGQWQRLAPSIFNPIRQAKRDALVSYITHKEEFDRPEQLFEFFLLDTGMEPIVKTSRLRLAISSVQTFIQRCFLNLEPKVKPSILRADHWQWMQRYRVWEANRKIFLYPENWLEPEFRDDKTHLYKELESELLQGDVNQELAEKAFFKYLKGLERIARLDIICIYNEENKYGERDVLHVVGRTFNQPYYYYYRNLKNDMWTPWEPIGAQIEGDHVTLIKWKNRLHLFWVTFLEKAKESDTPNITLDPNKKTTIPIKKAQKEVEICLNWSEYYEGEWKPMETGGFGNSMVRDVPNNFEKKKVYVFAVKSVYQNQESAFVGFRDDNSDGLKSLSEQGFWLHSKVGKIIEGGWFSFEWNPFVRSTPRVKIYDIKNSQFYEKFKNLEYTPKGLSLDSLNDIITESIEPTTVLNKRFNHYLTSHNPTSHNDNSKSIFLIPFFISDEKNCLFISQRVVKKTIANWNDAIIDFDKPSVDYDDLIGRISIEQLEPIRIDVPTVGPVINPLAKFKVRNAKDWLITRKDLSNNTFFNFEKFRISNDSVIRETLTDIN